MVSLLSHLNLPKNRPRLTRNHTLIFALILLMALTRAEARELTPLRLAPAPAAKGEDCDQHGPQPPKTPTKPHRGGKPSSSPGGRPGQQGALESEHVPQPIRSYVFKEPRRQARVEAFVRRPDGSVILPTLQLGANPSLSFPTPMGEGPCHGANNVYLVEQGVEEQVLVVRIAQWLTMHHNCGWGHEHKFDAERTHPQALKTIPLEIVIGDLWDPNFHGKVTSGQQLVITVLNYGKPLVGAKVRVQSGENWLKEVSTDTDGIASLQLIRDYYPTKWSDFLRTRRAEFLVTALYEAEESGTFDDLPYQRVRYISTLPWQYAPAREDYTSYSLGLLVGLLGFTFTGGGIYFYRERRKKPYKGISLEE